MHTIQPPKNSIKSQVRDAAIRICTTNSHPITREMLNGVSYFTTTRRGVSYCAFQSEGSEQWFVSSQRLALGRMHIGGGRYYKNLDDLAANCKAFAALPVLLSLSI